MADNSEIEEGEACCYYNVDDDGSDHIDPDVALGYIDQKLQDVLGSSQKDFEGLISAEILGPKFGEYGSFLPTYQRAPSIWSQSKTTQKSCSSRSPGEGLSQHVSASPNIKPESALSAVHLSHNSRKPCRDVVHNDLNAPSTRSSKKSHSDNETAVMLSNTSEKKSLKIRIKLCSGSDSMKRKTAAICSGLGLEDTPSSSLGNSPETSEDARASNDTVENSPTSMLKVMTSFPISEGFLISPLSDSLLSLVRNRGDRMGMNPVSTFRCGQEHSSSSTEKPASLPGEMKSIKRKKSESKVKRGRPVEMRLGDANSSESNITCVKKKIERSLLDGKKPRSNELNLTSFAKTSCDAGGSVEVVTREPDTCGATGRDDTNGNLYIADLTMEDSVELIVGQESGKSKRTKINKSLEQTGDNRGFESSIGAPMHLGSNVNCKEGQVYTITRAQQMEDSKFLSPPKQKLQKSLFHEQSEIRLASRGEKSLEDGKKKSKGIPGCSKLAFSANTNFLKGRNEALQKNKEAASSFDQINFSNLMLEKAVSRVQKIEDNMDTTSKVTDRKMVPGKVSKVSCYEKTKSDKPQGKLTARGTDDNTIKNGSQRDLYGTENGPTSNVAPVATAPMLIAEDWVCCDDCEKWRLLPYGTKLEHLPDKWLCSMLNWLPGMNSCDISEEETTKALHELYQVLPTQNQDHLQAQRNVSACQSTSGAVQHLDQNHQKINPSGMSIPRKKKSSFEELPKRGKTGDSVQILDVAKNKGQQSLRSSNLSDRNQTLKGSRVVKNLYNFAGGSKTIKMKNKDGDQHDFGVVKKKKLQCVHGDGYQNTDIDAGRPVLKSSAKLPYKENERVAQNLDEQCALEEPKGIGNMRHLISSKDQPQNSSNSLDVRQRMNGGISSTKRKLKDIQMDHGNHIEDKNVISKEESSESGSRKNKKLKAMKTEWADKNTDIGENEQQGRGKMAKVLLSDDRVTLVDNTKESSQSYQDQQPMNFQRKMTSKLTLEAMDALRFDMGSDPIMASSSSKVPGSLKAKAHYNEVKSSPVESVSSSPLKITKTDKQPSAEEDIASKDYSTHCDLPVMPKPIQSSGGKFVCESNQSRSLWNQDLSVDSCKFLALDNCNLAGSKVSSSGRSLKVADIHMDNYGADKIEKDGQCAVELSSKDGLFNEDRIRRKQHWHKGLISGNDFSFLTRNKKCTFDFEKDKMNVPDPTTRDNPKPWMGNQKRGMSSGQELHGLQIARLDEQPVSGNKNEAHYSFAHLSTDNNAATERDALNPCGKDSFSPTIDDALKEAMFLRDKADRLKCTGYGLESNKTYFQAALKFLHRASIFENCNGGISKQEMSEIQMYMTAAKLFENCAREFENFQEMAAAALSYKGLEVAYMRVVYCKSSNMSKDWLGSNETLQTATKGESPSSSASDVDNSNNLAAVDRDNISKSAGSYGSETHAASSRNCPDFARLLDFTQDVSSAMEASRKSQIAFAAANINLDDNQKHEYIAKVKRVIDFSFQDVEGLVSLMEQAWRAMSFLSLNGSKD